ncbi:MAG: cupin domain-containing protein [Cryomorphaceae bacterium]
MNPVNINEKFKRFNDHWNPRIVGALNGQHVKLARLHGAFVWHSHEKEDELFLVISGVLTMEFRDKTAVVRPGEFIIVPAGVEHRPVATEEVEVLLFEPASTVNTGDVVDDKTRNDLEWI